MQFADYLGNIERKLQKNFDMKRNYFINGYQYDFFAKHHLRMERYILTKKAVIDVMESNEFCFIKYFDKLNREEFKTFTDSLIKSIDLLLNLDEGHMASIITGVMVLAEEPGTDIPDLVKKFKYHKGFAFGLKGWVDIRLVLVVMEQKSIIANKKGKEVLKVYSI